MKTAKVEYAPDYKSDARSIAEIAASHICTEDCDPDKRLLAAAHRHVDGIRAGRATERARLEREVIEAAKIWADHPETPKPSSEDIPLYDAVVALVEFEENAKGDR